MKHVPGLSLAAILILAATSWVQAQELMAEFHDRDVEVHNYSDYSMDTLTATPSSGQTESVNLLHFALPGNQGVEVFISNTEPETCEFDLRASFSDGSHQCRKAVDLCWTERVTFFDLNTDELEAEFACD